MENTDITPSESKIVITEHENNVRKVLIILNGLQYGDAEFVLRDAISRLRTYSILMISDH